MAIVKLDYVPGVSETITDEPLADLPVLNTWYHLKIGNYKNVIATPVFKQSAIVLPSSAYELEVDTKYTAREVNESGLVVNALWRIVDNTYAGIATTVSGENFGSYVSNEALEARLLNKLDKTGDILVADNISFTEWTDKGSGASVGDTYDLDVSNLQKYNKTSLAAYLITLSNGADGTYIIKLVNGSGGAITVTASGGTIVYPAGETNFTLATGNTGLYTIVKDGTTHYITQTEF